MKSTVSKVVKIAVAVVLAGVLGAAAWMGVPHLTGGNHDVPDQTLQTPIDMMKWMLRGAEKGEPQKIWNGMTVGFRAQFVAYFNQVRKGAVPADPWLKAASDAGIASDIAGLAALDDPSMFKVWWNLSERSVVGFRLPAFLRRPINSRAETVLEKTFWDAPPLDARKNYILYKIDGTSDLLHFVRVGGSWRLDILDDVPDGM